MHRADRYEHRRHIQRAAPAKFPRRPSRHHKRQRAAKLVARPDDADGATSLVRRKPIRRRSHRGWPAERLHVTVARPDERHKIKSGGPAENYIESRRREQTYREQFARTPMFRHLAVDKLARPVSQLETHQHRAELFRGVMKFLFDAGNGDAEIGAAKIK